MRIVPPAMSAHDPRPASPGPDQLVTSSDLVRHFGLWQERAARMPLYILHRGRPRFVLASIETMDALCAPHDPVTAPPGLDAAALLDGIGDFVLVADADARIIAASRTARAHFGALAATGARLDAVAPLATRPFLADTIARVAESGVAEHLELSSPTRDGRMLTATLAPVGRGTALFAQDATGARDHARAAAAARALGEAMTTAGGVATVTLSPRGYIVDPGPALATLTGLAREALAMIRFVALSEIGGRVALGDAVERVLTDGAAEALDVSLLVNRAAPVRVRIGLAAVRVGLAIEGAVGSITVRAG